MVARAEVVVCVLPYCGADVLLGWMGAERQNEQNSVINLLLACWRDLEAELIVHRRGEGQSRSELGALRPVWGGRIAVVEHQTYDLSTVSSLFSITTSTSTSAIFTPVYQDRIFCYTQLTPQIDILLCSFFSRSRGHLPFSPVLLFNSIFSTSMAPIPSNFLCNQS